MFTMYVEKVAERFKETCNLDNMAWKVFLVIAALTVFLLFLFWVNESFVLNWDAHDFIEMFYVGPLVVLFYVTLLGVIGFFIWVTMIPGALMIGLIAIGIYRRATKEETTYRIEYR